ncbi:hypothetical protein [Archangium violaceum]|uniref:Uncharacterized protein n=1 Tax=Archangium violaceum Cb vi76 TaxID=1406225 RepID=A0A084SWU6_9BACT|nr:hypothetical protein [Archangium violaceum]KFA92931.1 hypothetical protein Q664_12505 [Archangium violaceum Cb vi76]
MLDETRAALGRELSPQALLSSLVWAAGLYLALWLLPEPTTKLLAAGLSVMLLAWLGVDALWGLMDGWASMAHAAHEATTDRLGDELQAAVKEFAARWSPARLSTEERKAIESMLERGLQHRADLLERQARGRWVEAQMRLRFPGLSWNSRGVDITGPGGQSYHYEILSGTDSNFALHGRRMASTFFRMIFF